MGHCSYWDKKKPLNGENEKNPDFNGQPRFLEGDKLLLQRSQQGSKKRRTKRREEEKTGTGEMPEEVWVPAIQKIGNDPNSIEIKKRGTEGNNNAANKGSLPKNQILSKLNPKR